MKCSWLHRCALAGACALFAVPAFAQVPAAPAQPPQPRDRTAGEQIRGRIVRTVSPDQVIMRTADNREVTLYTNDRTRFLMNNQAARFADLRAGSDITAVYVPEGNRWIASSFTIVPAATGTAPVPTQPPPVTTTQPPATTTQPPVAGTEVTGTVVRVVGQDQVVLRTTDGREVVVYTTPQTTYLFNNQPGVFTDIRPGIPLGVTYDVHDRRFMARRFFTPRR